VLHEVVDFPPIRWTISRQARHGLCTPTLNHNLAYCYDDARLKKWLVEEGEEQLPGRCDELRGLTHSCNQNSVRATIAILSASQWLVLATFVCSVRIFVSAI
jgi:hypothetical protein